MKKVLALCALAALAACKPPPTDRDLARDAPAAEPSFASEPLPSPETEGALWAQTETAGRIIYGVPGEPVLMALQCVKSKDDNLMQITRMSPADEGAFAFLALIGNRVIGRIEVDATEVSGRTIWQGEIEAKSRLLNALDGPKSVTATIPGAGLVELNPSIEPMKLLAECRGEPIAPEDLPELETDEPDQ